VDIKVKLDSVLQEFAGNRGKVEVNGITVRQCLDDLIKRFPRMKNRLFDKNGLMIPMVILNDKALSPEELNRPVTENDELWLFNSFEGG
jgi:molybdopterin converting factor small subunit